MSTLPPFQMGVTGEYSGNSYPEQREYRVTMTQDPTDGIQLNVEDTGGFPVAEPLHITPELIDGITWMALTNHSLDGYEDDWTLPAGMDRVMTWDLQTHADVYISLSEPEIGEIAEWLRYASGEDEYNGNPDEWEGN